MIEKKNSIFGEFFLGKKIQERKFLLINFLDHKIKSNNYKCILSISNK